MPITDWWPLLATINEWEIVQSKCLRIIEFYEEYAYQKSMKIYINSLVIAAKYLQFTCIFKCSSIGKKQTLVFLVGFVILSKKNNKNIT